MASARELDEAFLRRAIRLAMNGRGGVEPNPMVGCVLVKDGHVIGEGYHALFGGPHAEPNALANCTESPAGATAYVTLEPCCHTGKKTPPCVPRLIEAKLARVVIGCLDPNPDVNGRGIAMLRAAGIQVNGPVLQMEAKQLIAPFIAITRRSPYITIKWAQSADHRIAGSEGKRIQITNAVSNRVVHQLRANVKAIITGVGTVLADDPLLTVRHVPTVHQPVRVVLDRRMRLPADSNLVRTAREVPTVVFTDEAWLSPKFGQRRGTLEQAGALVATVPAHPDGVDLSAVIDELARMGLGELLVEAGPTLVARHLVEGKVDRLWVFESPIAIDESSAPAAPAVPPSYVQTGTVDLAGDTLTEYLNPVSPVFFAVEPSADFVLADERKQ